MSRVTLKDVAARAGVSYQTVSKVLNNRAQVTPKTRERIWQAVRELNYRPNISARNLRTRASNLIGYAWHYTPDEFIHPVLDAFVHSVANAAEAHGFHLLTFLAGQGPTRADVYHELFSRNQVAGFLLADTVHNDRRVEMLLDEGIPFVTFGRANDDWDFHWVDVDGEYGMHTVVQHLLDRGHRCIGFITWPEGSQSGSYREAGYRRALRESGVEVREEWIMRGENSAELGQRGVQQLMQLDAASRPTAVVCVSDLIAMGALNGATSLGMEVGKDLAITGFDDVSLVQYTQPPLTSVRQPIAAAGEQVIDLLLRQIHGEEITQKGILLKPELIIRASS